MVTKRQKEMLDYLQAFIAEHGYAPTLDEIGQHFSLASLATVHKHLGNLERKGFIRRLRHERTEEFQYRFGFRYGVHHQTDPHVWSDRMNRKLEGSDDAKVGAAAAYFWSG